MANLFPSSMPYDVVNIYDQSVYTEETPVEGPYIPSGPILLCPFISPRGYGRDGVLKYMNAAMLAKYGTPNLKKYGLSLYLAKQFMAGGGSVLGIRVVSDKATYAHLCVYAEVTKSIKAVCAALYNSNTDTTKYHPYWTSAAAPATDIYFNEITMDNPNDTDSIGDDGDTFTVNTGSGTANYTLRVTTENGNTTYSLVSVTPGEEGQSTETVVYSLKTSNPVVVKYKTVSFNGDNATDPVAAFDAWTNGTATKVPADGELTPDTIYYVPIFCVKAKATGEFANAFKFRLTVDNTMNSEADANNYDAFFYKFIDSDNGGFLDNNMTFTFNSEFMYDDESMSAADVFDTYSNNIELVVADDFNLFVNMLNVNGCFKTGSTSPYTTDILFGTNVDASKYMVDVYSAGSINLSSATGFSLVNGSTSYDPNDNFLREFSWNDDPFAEALARVYNGEVTDLIYDEVRYPYEYIFAPSCDVDVISAIHNLVMNRRLTHAEYMLPACSTYYQARAYRKDLLSDITSWKERIFAEWGMTRDPYTGKKTLMPSVYFNAYYYPEHWIKKKGRAYAGIKNFYWTGFITGTLCPSSTNTQEYIENHNVGMNTMVENGLGYATAYEQITAQGVTSRLSEINNSIILCEMVRIALRIANEQRWTDLGDTEIANYKTLVETAIAGELGTCYRTLTVTTERESVNGAGRNRIHCIIYVLFKDMLKGVTYDFYVLAK